MTDTSGDNLRLAKMAKLVFNADHLEEMRGAMDEVFIIFQEILRKPFVSFKDVNDRLKDVDEGKWRSVRMKYIHEDYTGYGDEDFTNLENLSVAKILLDLLTLVDECNQAVIRKLEEKHREMFAMEGKVNQMEDRISSTEDMYLSLKNKYNEKYSENVGLVAKQFHLQELLEEKNKRIMELERSSNVQLWELEKSRILKDANEKIEDLESQVRELQQGRETYKRRMSNIDGSYRKLLMRRELSERCSSPIPEEGKDCNDGKDSKDELTESEQLSKKNFMQDKDIAHLEKKLYDLQSIAVGVIGGIKTDFTKMADKFIDRDNGSIDCQYEELSSRMKKIYIAMVNNDIDKVKDVLPPHYRYREDDSFKIRKIRRLSTPAILPTTRVLHNIVQEKNPTQNGTNDEVKANPEIVNAATRRIHPINAVKYFPHMAQSFILDQHEKFIDFDKNSDGSLDLTEMVGAVTQLGFTFSAHQLQEALEEVDHDQSHMLDFYEYLLIIDNIYRRHGKAELFKTGLTELRSKNMSKLCSVQ